MDEKTIAPGAGPAPAPGPSARGRRVRVKICGVTTPEDALLAAAVGADAIGLNFHPPSPRAIDLAMATAIARALPPFITKVGVFVDPDARRVKAALAAAPLDCLQFHGDEAAEFCNSFGLPYIKAAGVGAGFDFDALRRRHPQASAFLLDAFDRERIGGTGRAFDWRAWPRSDCPLVLAGGLDADNVAAAIAATRPYAVDVASGVEGAAKGRKDARRMARFMAAAA